jgi:hypothetical protein
MRDVNSEKMKLAWYLDVEFLTALLVSTALHLFTIYKTSSLTLICRATAANELELVPARNRRTQWSKILRIKLSSLNWNLQVLIPSVPLSDPPSWLLEESQRI